MSFIGHAGSVLILQYKKNSNISSMKLKLLILFLSFSLVSCGGSPSENSKTTIMDVIKYLEQVEWKDVHKRRVKVLGMSEEEYLTILSSASLVETYNSNEKACGKFESYQPKIASMVGAIEGGKISMSGLFSPEVYKYSDESGAILNAKSGLLVNNKCFAKGYFIFCGIPPYYMHDF